MISALLFPPRRGSAHEHHTKGGALRGAARVTPAAECGDPIAPALPPAFDAFRTLHGSCYLGYAQLHLPTPDACEAVALTWGLLLTHWPQVVSRPSPAAYGWHQLVHFTGSRSRPLGLATSSAEQYDAVLLHHALGYSLESVSAATGLHRATVAYLTSSWRPLPAHHRSAHESPGGRSRDHSCSS